MVQQCPTKLFFSTNSLEGVLVLVFLILLLTVRSSLTSATIILEVCCFPTTLWNPKIANLIPFILSRMSSFSHCLISLSLSVLFAGQAAPWRAPGQRQEQRAPVPRPHPLRVRRLSNGCISLHPLATINMPFKDQYRQGAARFLNFAETLAYVAYVHLFRATRWKQLWLWNVSRVITSAKINLLQRFNTKMRPKCVHTVYT